MLCRSKILLFSLLLLLLGAFPSQALLQSKNYKGKVVLVFDVENAHDNANEWFNGILTILSKNNVTCVFCFVGKYAETYPSHVRRVYDLGNDVGLHTYSHPNLTRLGYHEQYREIERNSKVIEDILGIKPNIFRAPFLEADSNTIKVLKAIDIKIDVSGHSPYRCPPTEDNLTRFSKAVDDWIVYYKKFWSDEQFVSEVKMQYLKVQSYDAPLIISFHPQIIGEHLPVLERIIVDLRQEGATFTTLTELTGFKPVKIRRGFVLPFGFDLFLIGSLSGITLTVALILLIRTKRAKKSKLEMRTPKPVFLNKGLEAVENQAGCTKRITLQSIARFGILASIIIVFTGKILYFLPIDIVLSIYTILITFRLFLIFFFSYTKYGDPADRESPLVGDGRISPSVSVIIPVKNEEKMIRKTVEAVLNSSYKNLEVIVVNDGSTDNTGVVLDELQRIYGIKVTHNPKNMGKRRAVLTGIQGSRGEILVMMDSDSIVERNSIENLVKAFLSDPSIGGICGHTRVFNVNKNLITKLQDTWYDGAFRIIKGMESSYGIVTCCPGCLSAYRRDAIVPYLDHWVNEKFMGRTVRSGDDRMLTNYVLGGSNLMVKLSSDEAEDRMLTNYSLLGWKTVYSEKSLVYTEVPDTFRKFVRQQIRWKKGWLRGNVFAASFFWKKPLICVLYYYLTLFLGLSSPFVVWHALLLFLLRGDYISFLLFVSGILYSGLLFGVEHRLKEKTKNWIYRPLINIVFLFFDMWMMFYALLTIRQEKWLTR